MKKEKEYEIQRRKSFTANDFYMRAVILISIRLLCIEICIFNAHATFK